MGASAARRHGTEASLCGCPAGHATKAGAQMLWRAGRRGGQDERWLGQVRRSGTAADRVAAATLLLQERAAANLDALDELLGWVGKRSGARAMAGQVRAPAEQDFGGCMRSPSPHARHRAAGLGWRALCLCTP